MQSTVCAAMCPNRDQNCPVCRGALSLKLFGMRANGAGQLCSLNKNSTACPEAQARSCFHPPSHLPLHHVKCSRSACSVAVSYKPPMLVTRVRLPACAYLMCLNARSAIPRFDSRMLARRVARLHPKRVNGIQRLSHYSRDLASGDLLPRVLFSWSERIAAEMIIQE